MDYKIGNIIRIRRKELGLTQAQLAEKLFVTNKAVSKWETGEANPDISLLPIIAQVLNMTTDELLGTEQTQNNTNNEEIDFATPLAVDQVKKPTAFDFVKCISLLILTIGFGVIALFFYFSSILAFNTDEVISSTGDANNQLFLIIFSAVVASIFTFVCVLLAKKLIRSIEIFNYSRLSRLRQLAKSSGTSLYYDLTGDEKKLINNKFLKTNWFLYTLFFVCIVVALVGIIVQPFNTITGLIFYICGCLGYLPVYVVILVKRKKFFKMHNIYI